MTSWLENKKKCILTKENTRRRRFRFQKNNETDKTSDPIQSNPWMNPIHVQLCCRGGRLHGPLVVIIHAILCCKPWLKIEPDLRSIELATATSVYAERWIWNLNLSSRSMGGRADCRVQTGTWHGTWSLTRDVCLVLPLGIRGRAKPGGWFTSTGRWATETMKSQVGLP